jgi:hypothetical protein
LRRTRPGVLRAREHALLRHGHGVRGRRPGHVPRQRACRCRRGLAVRTRAFRGISMAMTVM